MKKVTVILLILAVLMTQIIVFAENNEYFASVLEEDVYLNGEKVTQSSYKFLTYKNDVYMPMLPSIIHQLGYTLNYEDGSNHLNYNPKDDTLESMFLPFSTNYIVSFRYQKASLYINGQLYDESISPKPFYYANRLYVPLTDYTIDLMNISAVWENEVLYIDNLEETESLEMVTLDRDDIESFKSQVLKLEVEHYNGDLTSGSGFFIEDHILITNYHVIDGASSIRFVKDDLSYLITDYVIKGFNSFHDIAILELTDGLEPLNINYDSVLKENDVVYTISSPLGQQNIMTSGEVDLSLSQIFQFDAVALPGSSGGAIFNEYGQVTGIITSGNPNNMTENYGVPISMVNNIIHNDPITLDEFHHINDTVRNPNWVNVYEEDGKNYIQWEDTGANSYKVKIFKHHFMFTDFIMDSSEYVTSDCQISWDADLTCNYSIGVTASSNTEDLDLEYVFTYFNDRISRVPYLKSLLEFKNALVTDQDTIQIREIGFDIYDETLNVQIFIDEENYLKVVNFDSDAFIQMTEALEIIRQKVSDYYQVETDISLIHSQFGSVFSEEVLDLVNNISEVNNVPTSFHFSGTYGNLVFMTLAYSKHEFNHINYFTWESKRITQ